MRRAPRRGSGPARSGTRHARRRPRPLTTPNREHVPAQAEAVRRPVDPETDLILLAKRVAEQLPFGDVDTGRFEQAFAGFLQSVSKRPSATTVALVDRRDSYVRPSLDVHLLWSHPLERRDLAEMDELTTEHVEFLRALEMLSPSFNSHLDIVDPRPYSSPAAFGKNLAATLKPGAARILACDPLPR